MPAFSMDIGEETPEVENYEVNTVTSELLIIFSVYFLVINVFVELAW